jgi:short-subunit dehydrogenase
LALLGRRAQAAEPRDVGAADRVGAATGGITTMTDTKHAHVQGAGPGLGAALARRFGREGFAVTVAARDEQRLGAIAKQLRGEGITVDVATVDAAEPKAFQAQLTALAEKITPSVVVYNAAVIAQDNVLTSDIDYLTTSYNVDTFGAIVAAQVFVPAMRAAGEGSFLVTGGYAGVDPYPAYATLGIGKAAVRAVTTLLFKELKDEGVHAASVTVAGAIEPGTPMAPELIAERFWELHTQPSTEWVGETLFDGTATL